MTEYHTDNNPAELTPVVSRAVKSNVGLRWVFGIPLIDVIVVLGIVFGVFAA